MDLTVTFQESELPELKILLNRALNCWDPKDAPAWAFELDKLVQQRLEDLCMAKQ